MSIEEEQRQLDEYKKEIDISIDPVNKESFNNTWTRIKDFSIDQKASFIKIFRMYMVDIITFKNCTQKYIIMNHMNTLMDSISVVLLPLPVFPPAAPEPFDISVKNFYKKLENMYKLYKKMSALLISCGSGFKKSKRSSKAKQRSSKTKQRSSKTKQRSSKTKL